jgi:signal transduction histidine kinase
VSSPDSPFECFAAELGRKALMGGDLTELAADAAAAIREHLDVDFSSVLQLRSDGQALFLAGEGWDAGIVGKATVELGLETAGGYVIRTQVPLSIEDMVSDNRFEYSPLLQAHMVTSSLLVPLIGRNRPFGIFGAHSRKRRYFSPREITEMQILANALSFAAAAADDQRLDRDKKLLRAEQMMAIGQVAAGVAHELRNPLTSIKGLVQVNLRDLQARDLPTDDLAIIEHEIRRMERTLQTLLDFARPPKPKRETIHLDAVIDRVLALVGGRARKQDVAIVFDRPANSITAEADFDQIQQVLLNLVLNALAAC